MALHGPRFILIEFAAGVLGFALLWIALNYVPLLLHAIDLAKSGTARQETAFELARPDLVRRYGLLQLWILVPFAIVVFAAMQRRKPPA